MKLTINCAYCDQPHSFQQRDFKSAVRSLEMFAFKCNACGSTTSVELSTKRKRQGAGYKAIVAKREAEHALKVEAAKKRNTLIELKLLAQTGCICQLLRDRWQGDPQELIRRRAEYGHGFFSAAITYGIPAEPHHERECPLRGSVEECEARGLKHGGTPRKGAA